ncbi:MAG: polyprenyl synthetase family protein [Pseudomonadota bacterium]
MFLDRLRADAVRVQAFLDQALAGYADQPVTRAMRYAVRGGKGLRGFLVLEGARLHGVSEARAVYAAASAEAMHAYSLVHDDLPCMDDDDLRRGRPTVHVEWDEATAVLAGDALQALAFDLLAREGCASDPAIRVRLVAGLACASGIGGMVLGQAQDIAAETADRPLTLDEITELQNNKTGALISWSSAAGAILGRADEEPLRRYAGALGLAFQIADDILDVEGNVGSTGKRVGKDARAGKATFVSLLGLEGAKSLARDLVSEAETALTPYRDAGEMLRRAARFVLQRES